MKSTTFLIVFVCIACCGRLFAQKSTALSPEASAILSAISTADAEELNTMSRSVVSLSPEVISPSLRIKASGQIADRLLELELVDEAIAQYNVAVSLPHSDGEGSDGCADMWSVAMDGLLWHFHRTEQIHKILPTLDSSAKHSDSVCFKVRFHQLRTKWMLYSNDPEGSKQYVKDQVVKLFKSPPKRPAEYELHALADLVNQLDWRDIELRISLLKKLANDAESYVREGGSLTPYYAFCNSRHALRAIAVGKQEENTDISCYVEGAVELAAIAISNASGENSEAVKERIQLICDLFKKQQEELLAKLARPALVGQVAPELNGQSILPAEFKSLESLRGKVIVLDFWAVWCGPCVASFPKMQELHNEFAAEGLVVVGVTNWEGYEWDIEKDAPVRINSTEKDVEGSDTRDHSREVFALRKFLKQHKVNYPQVAVTPEVSNLYDVEALPTLVVIDREGVVKRVLTGGSKESHAALRRAIELLLNRR